MTPATSTTNEAIDAPAEGNASSWNEFTSRINSCQWRHNWMATKKATRCDLLAHNLTNFSADSSSRVDWHGSVAPSPRHQLVSGPIQMLMSTRVPFWTISWHLSSQFYPSVGGSRWKETTESFVIQMLPPSARGPHRKHVPLITRIVVISTVRPTRCKSNARCRILTSQNSWQSSTLFIRYNQPPSATSRERPLPNHKPLLFCSCLVYFSLPSPYWPTKSQFMSFTKQIPKKKRVH